MTNPTPHGQVPEALIDLIDAYAETRHRYGGIYNAKTEAARKAVIEALSGVQALSAAPAPAIGDELRDTLVAVSAAIAERDDRAAQKMICEILAASTTPPAEQAAPKAAPGVGNSGFDHKTAADFLNGKTVSDEAVRAFVAASRWAHDERAALSATLLAMHGVLTSREAEIALLKKALLEAETATQQEAQEPVAWLNPWRADQVTTDYDAYGERGIPLYTAPQPTPAPAPLSDGVVKDAARWRMAALIGNEVMLHPDKRTHAAAVKAYMDATHSGSDLTGAVDAAIAAQGGK